jgi:hypothetical protein
MRIASRTFQGFNQVDSFVALNVLIRKIWNRTLPIAAFRKGPVLRHRAELL